MAHVTHARIDVAGLLAAVAGPGRGGTAIFLGSVRSGPEDGPVARIEYTAYDDMLEREFGRILDEARARCPGVAIAALHRLGAVPTGDASIAVAVAAPHRDQAFVVCREVVEEAKRRLPVWKREILEDGTSHWRDNAGTRVTSEGGP